jgi:hypothetical protein
LRHYKAVSVIQYHKGFQDREEITMKKSIGVLGFVVMSLITVLLVQSQLWGYGGVGNPFEISPNAAGTKYSGPLTIYFECVPILDRKGNVINPCDPNVNHMYFFVRLNQGGNYYHYSYDAGVVPYDNASMLAAFRAFIETKLIPDVCTTSPCPTFENGGVALKQTSNVYYNLDFSPGYLIADIVIAVQQ